MSRYRRTVTLDSPRELSELLHSLLAGESLCLKLDVPVIANEAFFLQLRAPDRRSPPIACVGCAPYDRGRQQVRATPTLGSKLGPYLPEASSTEDWVFDNLGPPPPVSDEDEALRPL